MSSIIASPPVGITSGASQMFDDLQKVGFAPVRQDIIKIQKIQVFWHPLVFTEISGITVSYLVRNGNDTKTVDVHHGSGISGDPNAVELKGTEYLVGIFGSVDGRKDTAGALRTLNFLIFDNNSGEVKKFCPQPPKNKGGHGPVFPVTGFSSYGLIIAFGGSVSSEPQREEVLQAITVYKYLPGEGGVNIV